jgi:hypothetical protein
MLTPPEANMILYGALTNLKYDTATLTEKSRHRIPIVNKDGRLLDSSGNIIEPKIGDILAIKSTTIPYEECAANIYTNFNKITKNKNNAKTRYCRKKTEGNGLYIYGSVEYVIYTGEPSKKSMLKKKEKIQLLSHKNVRLYPATGRAQIPGIKPNTDNPTDLMNYVLQFVSKDLDCNTLKILDERNNMVNSKLAIIEDETTINAYIDLYALANLFDKIRVENTFPFVIIFVTESPMVCSHMFIRFSTPIDNNAKRKTTLKIFSSKKINVFGSPSYDITDKICKALDDIFVEYKDTIIKQRDTYTSTVIEETDVTRMF